MLTPLKAETYNRIQLNAGVFVTGLDPSKYEKLSDFETALLQAMDNVETCLGATKGGGTFQVAKEMRDPEFDGSRNKFIGSTIVDSQDPSIATTLVEVTPGNLKKLMVTVDVTGTGTERMIFTPRTDIKDDDYIDFLTWAGETRHGYMVIVLENAINMSNGTITITDRGEATMAVEFHGTSGDVHADRPPYMLYRYEPVPETAETNNVAV